MNDFFRRILVGDFSKLPTYIFYVLFGFVLISLCGTLFSAITLDVVGLFLFVTTLLIVTELIYITYFKELKKLLKLEDITFSSVISLKLYAAFCSAPIVLIIMGISYLIRILYSGIQYVHIIIKIIEDSIVLLCKYIVYAYETYSIFLIVIVGCIIFVIIYIFINLLIAKYLDGGKRNGKK